MLADLIFNVRTFFHKTAVRVALTVTVWLVIWAILPTVILCLGGRGLVALAGLFVGLFATFGGASFAISEHQAQRRRSPLTLSDFLLGVENAPRRRTIA
jgi:hypothetical protein